MSSRDVIIRILGENLFGPSVEAATGQLKSLGASVADVGTSILPLSLAVSGVGIGAIKMATDFNQSMANVASLIPGNVDHVNALKSSVQSMAIEVGKSTGDLAGGLYQAISAFGDTNDVVKILEINAKAAAAGVASTQEAINLTSGVTKGYGDASAGAVQHAADLALQTVKLGQTTFPELAAAMGKIVPLASSLKVSQEELFGTMATFTGVTGNASEVSTQLRGVLQSLMAPTDSMQQLFRKLGVESGQALIEQKGLQGAIEQIVGAATKSGEPLQKYLGSIEGQTLALAAVGGQADNFKEKIAAMSDVVGVTATAFDAQTQGVNKAGFAWEQFKQTAAVAMQNLGDEILPVILSVADSLKPLMGVVLDLGHWFGELPGPVKATAVVIGGLVAVAGPALIAIGGMVSMIGTALPVLGTVGTAIATFATGPIGLLVAAVVGLGLAWATWGDDVKRIVSDTYTAVKTWLWDKLGPVLTPIGELLHSVGGMFEAFRDLVAAVGLKVVGYVATMVIDVGRWLYDKFKPVIDPALTLVKGIASVFGSVRDASIGAAKALYEGVKTYLIDRFTSIVDGIKSKIDAVSGFFKNLHDAVVGHSYVPDLVNGIGTWFGKLTEKMVTPAQGATGEVATAFAEMGVKIGGYATTLIESLKGGWDGFKTAAKGVLNDIVSYMESYFVKEVLRYFGLVEAGGKGAFAGIATQATTSGTEIVGSTSGTTTTSLGHWGTYWSSWMGYLNAAMIAWSLWNKFVVTHDPYVSMPPPAGPPPNIPQNPEQGGSEWQAGLAYAQKLYDQAASTGWVYGSDAFYSYMDQHPEFWGHGQGFKEGTHGQYLNFGAGTPVVLHGYERVMTAAEGRAEAKPAVVNITFHNSFINAEGLQRASQELADIIVDKVRSSGTMKARFNHALAY